MTDFTTEDVYSFAEELAEVLDGHGVNLGISAVMTAIANLCAYCSDDKAEFAATMARVASDLNAGCDRPLPSAPAHTKDQHHEH